MPELPEVETTRRGIEPHLLHRRIVTVRVRERRLRWPVSAALPKHLTGGRILRVGRRGKYLLIGLDSGTLLAHLGMSGSLRIVAADAAAGRHDHVDLVLDNGKALRLTDPRRFGSLHWTAGEPRRHKLLRELGPEPLGDEFTGAWLFRRARGRTLNVKAFIMDGHTVTGVGNIYANEALFMAGINPARAAGRIAEARYDKLSESIKSVLARAIELGGTTLRDFVGGDGRPGYFQQTLCVYGRTGEPCRACGAPIRERRLGQRSTFYCSTCQR
jgi:formamidopyrimidine-DNA glycosylase